jgi:hypothetical protein
MEFNRQELKIILNALVFITSADVIFDNDDFDTETALSLLEKLNDESIKLDCHLYKGSGYYEEEVSEKIEKLIPQIIVEERRNHD